MPRVSWVRSSPNKPKVDNTINIYKCETVMYQSSKSKTYKPFILEKHFNKIPENYG